MRKDCDTCLHDEFGEKWCNDCYWANGKPPTKWEPAPFWTPDTNGDRIRAMSDEELAKFMNLCGHDFPPYCDVESSISGECDQNCIKCAEKWLKQPAEEGADNG